MADRRDLDFPDFDAINRDVEALLSGHNTVGAWSLPEILSHLNKAIRLTMRGSKEDQTPGQVTAEQEAARKRFFTNRKMPEGRPMPGPILAPSQDQSAMEGAARLRTALEKFREYEGTLPEHPALGPLTREEWMQFHCIHCAHHLSFAAPKPME